MKISYKQLKNYLNASLTVEEIAIILTDLGLEVEGTEDIETVRGGLRGLVVGEVLSCEKHPNADKLSLTKVAVGEGRILDIVCGAPNVATGQKVIVALEGATLYPSEGEPFTIKKGKIRGETSEGMICAEDEIGMGTSHAGIMVLPASTRVGLAAATYFKVENDTVIEIGLTPNRADAFSHVGVAQDLAAYLAVHRDIKNALKMPDVARFTPTVYWIKDIDGENKAVKVQTLEETSASFEVKGLGEFSLEIANTAQCPHYSGVVIRGVKVGESPEWLKNFLLTIGSRPINNIVDVTNFVMHELGQPLHAFDLSAIAKQKVIVGNLPAETKFLALDGSERQLHEEDLMICDGNNQGMCIAGVFGGLNSGVKDTTVDIFLESAYFNPKSTRRTSTRHSLRTDAAVRFEKGTDPNNTVFALVRAAQLIIELAGGTTASDVIDLYPTPIKPVVVALKYKNIDRLIGNNLSMPKVKAILSALNMTMFDEQKEGLSVVVPSNKPDVTREADVIEEILRVYGFNNVEFSSSIRSAISFAPNPDPYRVRNAAADYLAANGFREMMAVTMTRSAYARDIVPFDESKCVYINNTSNQTLDLMRPTMLFGVLEAVAHNQNRQNPDVRLFEFGRTYVKNESSYAETQRLALAVTGKRYSESWLTNDKSQINFYSLKAVLQNLFTKLGVKNLRTEVITESDIFSYGLRLTRGREVVIEYGEVKKAVVKKMDIKNPVLYAEINWDLCLEILKNNKIRFAEISKFPTVRRDLALILDQQVVFGDLADTARKAAKDVLKEVNLFDVFADETKLGAGKKSYALSFTFNDDSKTLQDKDIDGIVNNLIKQFETKFNAEIRK
jgi:phenylalanyl-tRNA synthetase beta chain